MSRKKFVGVIAVIFILIGIGGGAFLYASPDALNITSPLQMTPTPIPATPTSSILLHDTEATKAVATAFYAAYADCMTNPPTQAKGKVSSYCQANTGFTTDDFVTNLKEGGTANAGGDPVLCSQNPSGSVSAESVDYEEPGRAIVTMIAVSGAGFAQKIPLLALKDANSWKISMVTCPRP